MDDKCARCGDDSAELHEIVRYPDKATVAPLARQTVCANCCTQLQHVLAVRFDGKDLDDVMAHVLAIADALSSILEQHEMRQP